MSRLKQEALYFKGHILTTLVFPGQGSQFKGMGKSLFEKYPHLVSQASNILGYAIDELCLQNPNNYLENTKYAQPAIYLCNALAFLERFENVGVASDTYLAGHSLGEYNALLAAGYFDFATGLKIVNKRAELMSNMQGGAMLAVVGLDLDTVQAQIVKSDLNGLEIANFNTPSQFVLSGERAKISLALEKFKSKGARAIMLKTSGAFHSQKMQPILEPFKQYLSSIAFSKPSHAVISNVTAKPFTSQLLTTLLTRQLVFPVRWTETIQLLIAKGEHEFIELGANKVLSGLCKNIYQSVLNDQTDASRSPLQKKTLFGFKDVIFTPDRKGYLEAL